MGEGAIPKEAEETKEASSIDSQEERGPQYMWQGLKHHGLEWSTTQDIRHLKQNNVHPNC